MSDDLTELDHIGPAREETLQELGYETYADLAESDYEKLADDVHRMNEDTALEIVVQAQNKADLEQAEVEEEPAVEEDEEDVSEDEEDVSEDEEDVSEDEEDVSEDEEDESGPYTVGIELSGSAEYNTFFHTLLEERNTLHRTNRAGAELYDNMLSAMRDSTDGEMVEIELTAEQLNNLHNAVLQQRIEYQGDNLINYMDALARVEAEINNEREEYLF